MHDWLARWGIAMLLVVGGLWLLCLILLQVYIEPGGAGSIRCGRPWQASEVEDFLEDACGDAVASRRRVMVIPALAVGAGLVLAAARRRSPGDDDRSG